MRCYINCTCKWLCIFCSRCSNKNDKLLQPPGGRCIEKLENETEEEESQTKKLKVDDDDKESVKSGNQLSVLTVKPTITVQSDMQPAPPFYFNLHRHSPKGP